MNFLFYWLCVVEVICFCFKIFVIWFEGIIVVGCVCRIVFFFLLFFCGCIFDVFLVEGVEICVVLGWICRVWKGCFLWFVLGILKCCCGGWWVKNFFGFVVFWIGGWCVIGGDWGKVIFVVLFCVLCEVWFRCLFMFGIFGWGFFVWIMLVCFFIYFVVKIIFFDL